MVHGDKVGGRRHPDPSGHHGGQLRRLVRHRRLRLRHRRGAREARPGDGRGQEPRRHPARRRPRPGGASDIIGAAYGSAGERCMALPVVVPGGREDRRGGAREAAGRDRDPEGRRLHRSRRPVRPGGLRRASSSRSRTTSSWATTRAPNWWLDGRGFALQGYEKGFFIGPTLFDHVKPDDEDLPGRDLRPGAADRPRRELRGGPGAAVQATPTATASPSSPATAAPRASSPPGQGRHGRHQCADPGAGGLPHLRRLEALAFGDTNQHGMEGRAFYTKVKTVTARWPEGS